VLWLPLLLLMIATVFDWRRREIPDWISVALLASAIGATALNVSQIGWLSLLFGFGIGALLGAGLFWIGALGGGDAKLLVALGATLGPTAFFVFLFYVALAGGVLALIAVLRGRRDLAYAPAMALGFLAFMILRGSW
jgi:prepilin peptidase CpaA